jgi:hypothetical protein
MVAALVAAVEAPPDGVRASNCPEFARPLCGNRQHTNES